MLHDRGLRLALILIGIPLTLVLGVFAALVVFTSLPDRPTGAALGFAGLVGIVSAWIRVVAARRMSKRLRMWVAIGLGLGSVAAAWVASGLLVDRHPILPWVGSAALVIGLFLLAATLGEKVRAE